MKKLQLLLLAFLLAFKGFSGIETIEFSIYFPSNSFALSEESLSSLESVLLDIPLNSEFEIYIQGHTDNEGTFDFNDVLSKNRATTVKDFFISKGIKVEVINMEYYGEKKPVKPNTTTYNKADNRRVSIQLTTIYFNSINDLENALKERTSTKVKINPNKQTLIKGKSGTKVLIEPNSFIDANGKIVTEDVTIELTEALSYDTFISHNLLTLSDGQLLISGGMFKVNATSLSGSTVTLKNNKALTVSVPASELAGNMQLFTSNTGSNWNTDGQKVNGKLQLNLPPYPKYEYVLKRLPSFKPDSASFPIKPELKNMPKDLKMPDQQKYAAKVKWYQFLWKGKIERNANDRYVSAMHRYEKRRLVYERRMELYKRDKTGLIQNMKDYKSKLVCWIEQNTNDSTDFYLSPNYIALKADNKKNIDAANVVYQNEIKEWKAIKKGKLEERTKKLMAMGTANRAVMDSYVMSITEMSWINIDRFYKMDADELMTIKVYDPDKTDEKVFLVFTEINSMLPLTKDVSEKYVNKKTPKKEKTAILAYKVIEGKAYVSYQKVSVRNKKYNLKFKPTTFKELKFLLNQINA